MHHDGSATPGVLSRVDSGDDPQVVAPVVADRAGTSRGRCGTRGGSRVVGVGGWAPTLTGARAGP
ncbi:hypothetical protein Ae168Ps1_4529 [Pseudonocardia sp. Ae168_Ps1]|nr:hypothetical protein Ae168Ps1_4529 [Pseudonocardia sp. Ae168_Ps1]OLL83763.1 hypothetical protein Ae263Ps1_0818c [Pseudonocardia sp. Ae263_Ps1]OLL90197.1 hypothetical protein Ae356Ps1_0094 [Pseudonocardia sp. Ae356_Ps1]